MMATRPTRAPRSFRRVGWRWAGAAACGVAFLVLAGIGPDQSGWLAPATNGPAWPASPDTARIKYVASISTPADIGAGPSVFGRIWGAIAGRSRQPRLMRPRGVTTDSAGRLLVADPDQAMVHVFDVARHRYSFIESAPFASPVGVAVGHDDAIYVTDSGRRRVFAYSREGKLTATLGVVNGEPIFIRPTGIAVGPDGLLYVVDTATASIVVLERTGRVMRTLGRRGSEPGEFNLPTDITIGKDGRLYVTDTMNARIQVLERDGTVVRTYGRRGNATGDFDKPKGLALDPDGHLYVVEGLHDVVQIFDAEGQLLLVVGSSGSDRGQFNLPSGMHIDRAGRLFVADSYNARVQVFQYVR